MCAGATRPRPSPPASSENARRCLPAGSLAAFPGAAGGALEPVRALRVLRLCASDALDACGNTHYRNGVTDSNRAHTQREPPRCVRMAG